MVTSEQTFGPVSFVRTGEVTWTGVELAICPRGRRVMMLPEDVNIFPAEGEKCLEPCVKLL